MTGQRRLAPLLVGTAAGSLGPGDLEEIGISVVAIYVLDLLVAPGADGIHAAGGLRRFIGWDGDIVAVEPASTEPSTSAPVAAATGWRARAPHHLVSEKDGVVKLRSSIDGGLVELRREAIAAFSAEAGVLVADDPTAVATWRDADAPPPQAAIVVSALAAEQAAAGRYHDGMAWRPIDAPGAAAGGAPVDGCQCRTCRRARRDYLEHLWSMREITATHLLAWHNLHQLRALVEG